MTRTLTAALLLALLSMNAAEPDWPVLEKNALDLLQRYLRIESVKPPADTREAASLIQAELMKSVIESRLYPAGPKGHQVKHLALIKGRDS
jgi:hypothetical protein